MIDAHHGNIDGVVAYLVKFCDQMVGLVLWASGENGHDLAVFVTEMT